jgi:hypothetical protein
MYIYIFRIYITKHEFDVGNSDNSRDFGGILKMVRAELIIPGWTDGRGHTPCDIFENTNQFF